MNDKAGTVASQLYEAISDAVENGWSINQLSKAVGVPQASLQFWYSGARQSLALETVCRLCDYFGMVLTEPTIPSPPDDVPEPRRKPKSKDTSSKKVAGKSGKKPDSKSSRRKMTKKRKS